MQAYRGLPILTNQPARPTRLVGIWPLDYEGSVGEYARSCPRGGRRGPGRRPDSCRGRGNRSLPPRRAGRPRRPASRRGGGAEALGGGLRPARRRRRPTRPSRSVIPRLRPIVHANDRRRVVRALELAEAGQSLEPGESRLWSTLTRHPDRRVRPRRPARGAGRDGSRRRTRRMFERGAEAEARAAAGRPLSRGARGIIGLHELTTLPLEEADDGHRDAHPALCRVPAKVDATDPRHCYR